MAERLGLIAGNGVLPALLARSAQEQGLEVYAVAHTGETDAGVEKYVDALTWVKVGQLSSIIKFFKRHSIQRVVMLGGITKASRLANFRPDWRGFKLLASLKLKGDDALLRAIANEFESEGIQIVSAADYLQKCIAPQGQISTRSLSAQEEQDTGLGWSVAKKIGALEIGQTVVLYRGVVVAVEAVEGTDAAIRRAGSLISLKKPCDKDGLVIVKTSKPGQDLRLDLPTVGLTTLDVMQEAGASALVLEAGRCLIENPADFQQKADLLKIAVRAQ